MKCGFFLSAAVAALFLPVAAFEDQKTSVDCVFLEHRDEFLSAHSRSTEGVNAKLAKIERMARRKSRTLDASEVPRINFIDEEIFGKLQQLNVPAAPLSTDEEFLRRVTLDLTGRISTPEQIRQFVADTDPNKRAVLIDRLIESSEFTDKWTWWMADLLQINSNASNFARQINGRNAFHAWLKMRMLENAPLRDIAYQTIVAQGNNFLMEEGATNFVVNSFTPGGPLQDQYDTMLVRTANTYLGMGYYDCVLCHNGRGHLDQLSLWGRTATRLEANRMAAFFSRQSIVNHPQQGDRGSFFAGARIVTERVTGQYDLNTTNGNRPPRCAPNATVANNRCSATMNVTPEYHVTGDKPQPGRNWRESFADNMVVDPMFARNFANRIWKEMFNLGLVDPVDTLDPARLDPANPPPDGWALQASHPELLERLANDLASNNFSLKAYLRLITNSNAYQLSSQYSSDWKVEYVPLFARHYPRRLEAEEIHDAIVTAIGVSTSYTVQGWTEPVKWAMQLPEPREPLSNTGNALNFMNAFLRGNRDLQQRSQLGSILQQLNMMNDQFVLTKNKVSASTKLRGLATSTDYNAVVEEMFLTFLSRKPSEKERSDSVAFLARAANQTARNTAVEDLAWALMNKIEFVFSY